MSYILDALRRADAERERGAVPSLHAKQYASLPSDEEPRRGFKDEMLGLEEGDVALRLAGGAPEAPEGMHLVDVAPHRLRHEFQAVDERLGRDLEEVALAVQHAPEEPVQKRVALRVAVADDALDEGRDGAGEAERRCRSEAARGGSE